MNPEQAKYLEDSIGWVCFSYPDGSKRYFSTTFCIDILGPVINSKPGPGYLYNLDKQKWTRIPRNMSDVVVEVFEEEPQFEELIRFGNKFV